MSHISRQASMSYCANKGLNLTRMAAKDFPSALTAVSKAVMLIKN